MSSEHDRFSAADDALKTSADPSDHLRCASERAFDEVYKDMGKSHVSTTGDTAVAERPKQEAPPTPKQDATPGKKDAPSKDARPSEADKPGITPDKTPRSDDRSSERSNEDPRLKERRERLDAAADKHITDPKNREQFRENMRKFEERAKNAKLSPDEVSNTYAAIERLLTAKQTDHFLPDQEQRAILAQNFMYHAVDPTNIDQGYNKTCNVTAMQEKIMTSNPSVAADMLSSAATTGKYISREDRKEITLDTRSMEPYKGLDGPVPPDGQRSYATQVLNHVMANEITQRRDPPQYYMQVRGMLPYPDNGERVRLGGFNGPDKMTGDEVMKEPGISIWDIHKGIERHTGEKDSAIYADKDNSARSFNSPEALREKLVTAKREGRLPLILYVNSADPALHGRPDEKPTRFGAHVVSVTGIDEKTGEVQISNQWGKQTDVKMHVDRLFKAASELTTEPR